MPVSGVTVADARVLEQLLLVVAKLGEAEYVE